MRVAYLVTDLQRGGTPLRLARQARLLTGAGVEMLVGCLAPPGPVSQQLEQDGIATFACGATRSWHLGALRRLRRTLIEWQPDLLHCTLTHANVAGRIATRPMGLPMIGGTATIERERPLHRWLERMTIHRDAAHTVGATCVRNHVAEQFGYPAEHIAIIPPLIDTATHPTRDKARAALGIDDEAFVALWIGRCDPVKRLEWLLPVARRLGPTARVALVGDGPEREPLEREIQRHDLAQRFILPGWVESPTQWRAAADVLLCPSLTEGMPNAVLEALAIGCPVVASDIPIHNELAEASGALLLADNPATFAEQVAALRSDPELRGHLSAAGQHWATKHLQPERTRDALLHLYRNVLVSK